MSKDVPRHRYYRPASFPGASQRRSIRETGMARAVRPELWLAALAAVGMLLVDVWQSSRMTELSIALDTSNRALQHARARRDCVQARLDRQTTRAELVPLASELGLAPADAQQVVQLPSEYLAEAADVPSEGKAPPALAWAERAARALVPEATARVRDKD